MRAEPASHALAMMKGAPGRCRRRNAATFSAIVGMTGPSLEAEDIFLLRPLHALLPVLLPDASPGPPVHVRHLELDRGAGRHRRRPALERKDRLHALDEGLRVALLESADPLDVADDAHRLDERFGVVQNRLVIETEERAVCVAVRRVDFDGLQAARVLEGSVSGPTLDIRGPGDEHIAIPETDRLAV